jgi:dUTP pyrophosphatase
MGLLPKWLLDKIEKALKKLADKLTPPPMIRYFLLYGRLEKSPENAGYDISSNETFTLAPGTRRLVSTGLTVELPSDYEIQIRPRSGLALKNGITVLNSPSTIDPGYRGEIKIILYNTSNTEFLVEKGMRIAQIIFHKLNPVILHQVSSLVDINMLTDRGASGFGSTGLK